MPDWITAIASILAAIAAAYGVVQGIANYKESLRVSKLAALVELENSFKGSLPFFARLEDDSIYESEIRPVVALTLANGPLNATQAQIQAELERAIRFFYVFWFRMSLMRDSHDLLRPYLYYLEQLRGRPEVRAYVERFYPDLIKSLDSGLQSSAQKLEVAQT
jgi:hypothetical protein